MFKFHVRSSEAKNRVFEFDYQKMNTFESVGYWKNHVQICLISNSVNIAKYYNLFDVPCAFV